MAVAAESAYGTAATAFTRVLPATDDSWTPEIQEVDTGAFRPNRQAMTADQTVQVPTGGTGTVTVNVAASGLFLMWRDLLDSFTAALGSVADSSLKRLSLRTDSVGPTATSARSLSFLVGRVDVNQARRETVYAGCVPTGWTLEASPGAPVTLAVEYDYASEADRTPSSSGSYAAPALSSVTDGPFYTWRDVAVSIGGTTLPTVTGLTVTADRALDTDRRYLDGDATKSVPIRGTGLPAYTVSVDAHLDSTTAALLANWGVDGTTGEIVVTLTGREDLKTGGSTPRYTSVTVTFAEAKIIGTQPVASLDGLTTVTVECQVVDPYTQSGVAGQIEVVSAQSAIN
ncbi:MAG: phage tail tube protein [bacterium]|nr:phage tail tube protein [bacterium]